jgi:acyl dehydratase
MPIDHKHIGKKYGPYKYEVSLEKIRDFANTVAGGVPTRVFPGEPVDRPHPYFLDEAAGKASPYGAVIAPPTFAVNFAMQPFATASADPDLDINLVMLVHGEQSFEFLDVIRAGDVMETVGEITKIYEKGKLDFLTVTTTSKNQSGKVVLKADWTAVIRNL